MKTLKHTSGPWAVSFPGGQTTFNGRRMTVTHNGSMIADLDWNSPAENLANAKLMAASPDLLDFANMVARSCCLDQRVSETCICFSCEAKRLLERINL